MTCATRYCRNCRFWIPIGWGGGEVPPDRLVSGECHCHSPGICASYPAGEHVAVLPHTYANEFCGDWQQKGDPK